MEDRPSTTISPIEPLPPYKRKQSQELSRDDRLRILTIRDLGHTYEFIANKVGCTLRQVRYTIQRGDPTPKKGRGRPRRITEEDKAKIIEFVTRSEVARKMKYQDITEALYPAKEFSWQTVRQVLYDAGYKRRRAVVKPALSEGNK